MRAVVVVLMLAACGDPHRQEAAPPAAAPASAAAAPASAAAASAPADASPALAVTLDGTPVHIADVVVWREAGWRQVIVASTHPLTCDLVTRRAYREEDSDLTFEVSLASTLRPDGTYAPQIRSTYYEGSISYKPSWAHATETAVDVDFELTGAARHHVLHVAGPLVASRSCPVPAPPPLTGTPQPATITIAGQQRAVRFAWFYPAGATDNFYGGDALLLYTGGESCEADRPPDSDLVVALVWLNASDTQPGSFALHGTAIGNVGGAASDLEVKPRPHGAGTYAIHGTAAVFGYSVEVAGRITVKTCARSP